MKEEEEEHDLNPFIIMVDKQTRCHVSSPTESSSTSDWIVNRLCENLESWGDMGKDVIIRCDGEPPIRLIRKSVACLRLGKQCQRI